MIQEPITTACCLASKDLHHKTPLVQLSHRCLYTSTSGEHLFRLIQHFSHSLA